MWQEAGQHELAIFTDNKADLAKVIGREDVVHTARTPQQVQEVDLAMLQPEIMEPRKDVSMQQELAVGV